MAKSKLKLVKPTTENRTVPLRRSGVLFPTNIAFSDKVYDKKYIASCAAIQPKPIAQPIIAIPTTTIQSVTKGERRFIARK
jgi:hypothetical protein